eukprot:CAMPEP_0177225650 /NCGR_PEP_ID=MMETSP0367-20130122/39659_1 /TAXON_ID=447022 ORGANISM="Scrippsiella hangoei-like, Strain SHHI-4" /NCGR_SAMPLE_ID=MMETSP0367 /ASSEMBLY_ACC=CAM_ASM_000362 /LENGTH=83 /DNA_ID=CAMNT_0018675757 /DNA_START=293 /DNA_END=544 /DNA_ORIENTATION=-
MRLGFVLQGMAAPDLATLVKDGSRPVPIGFVVLGNASVSGARPRSMSMAEGPAGAVGGASAKSCFACWGFGRMRRLGVISTFS